MSNEPFGLQAYSEKNLLEGNLYRLHNFYDYVRTNFGHRLAVQSYRSHWNLIDSVVESFATEDELQVNILKTVGILNLINDGDLLPTEESVVVALARFHPAERKQVQSALKKLHRERRVLYDRGRARGLCLWPHTSVDLEKAYEDAHAESLMPLSTWAALSRILLSPGLSSLGGITSKQATSVTLMSAIAQ